MKQDKEKEKEPEKLTASGSDKESFSARLRAQKDDEDDAEEDKKMNLTEQERKLPFACLMFTVRNADCGGQYTQERRTRTPSTKCEASYTH